MEMHANGPIAVIYFWKSLQKYTGQKQLFFPADGYYENTPLQWPNVLSWTQSYTKTQNVMIWYNVWYINLR